MTSGDRSELSPVGDTLSSGDAHNTTVSPTEPQVKPEMTSFTHTVPANSGKRFRPRTAPMRKRASKKVIRQGPTIRVTEAWLEMARKAFERTGLTQREFGARVGHSHVTISRFLRGQDTRSAVEFAIALGIPPPLVPINSEDQFEWYRFYDVLRRDEAIYRRVFRQVSQIVAGLEAVQAGDEGLGSIEPTPKKPK